MKRCLYNFVKAVLLMYFVFLVYLFLSPADWANHLLLTLEKFGPFASLLPLLCFDALFSVSHPNGTRSILSKSKRKI